MHRRRQWHPTPVLLPGESNGRRSLVDCSLWGCQESDTIERIHFHFSVSCIGEGMAIHFSVFAWRIPGTGEPGGLPSIGSHRVRHDWSDIAAVLRCMSSLHILEIIFFVVVSFSVAIIFSQFWRLHFSWVQFSRSVVSDSSRPHESQHARPPCPSPTPGVHPNSRPSSPWCHPAISSSVVPFSSCPFC